MIVSNSAKHYYYFKDENEICKVKGVIRALGIGETGKLNISMSGNFITAYDIKFSN